MGRALYNKNKFQVTGELKITKTDFYVDSFQHSAAALQNTGKHWKKGNHWQPS